MATARRLKNVCAEEEVRDYNGLKIRQPDEGLKQD